MCDSGSALRKMEQCEIDLLNTNLDLHNINPDTVVTGEFEGIARTPSGIGAGKLLHHEALRSG